MSLDMTLLDRVLLAAGTIFDARRQPLALRLTVGPLRPDVPVDPAGVLALVDEVAPPSAGPLVLDVADERALFALASTELAPNVWLEIPGFLATDDELAARLADRLAAGNKLVLRGRVPDDGPQGRWALFRYAVVDRANIRTPLPAGAGGQPPLRIFAGSDGPPMTAAALRAGFEAVQGWPVGDPPGRDSRPRPLPAAFATVVDLMQRVDREEPADKLEAVVRNDPSLGFRLMRYLNSPGFGLSVEISSFGHALMIVGYQRLKRWLALLVTSAIDDPELKPLMHLAVRRGLLMEALGQLGSDETLKGDLFICGVFSLLDRMLDQPFATLLASLPVSASVQQALVDEKGPCAPFLALALAVEQESLYEVRTHAETLLLAPGDVNRALVKSIVVARALTSGG